MDLTEKKISSKEVYHGKILRVKVDEVTLPNGKIALREVVEHPGSVAVLALDENNCVPMVQQFRYTMGRIMLEVPAGKIDPGEEPLQAAKRELKEEVGAEAEEWISLGHMVAAPGCYNEVIYLYLAKGLSFGECQPDEDEFLDMARMPLEELVEKCVAGEIADAKTQITVLKAKTILG